MTTTASPTLPPDQVLQLLQLADQSDGIELKLTVPASAYRQASKALGIDPLEAQIRQVFFFDTPDLALDRVGVVARARRIQGRPGDTTVKLRPLVPADLDRAVRTSRQFVAEVDAMPGGYVCSGSLKHEVSADAVLRSTSGGEPLRKLFSKEQRAFFAAHAPEGVEIDGLAVLGPILVLKLKLSPAELSSRLVLEVWIYPDGSRVVELSTKASPTDGLRLAVETRAFLEARGIPLSTEQQTKTRTALDFFAAELRPAS